MDYPHTQFPDDPEKYNHTNHYRDVLSYNGRFLTEQMVEETIRHGTDSIRSVDDARIRRRKTYDGVEVAVVLGPSKHGPPVIVTAWTEIASMVDAIQSDRWTQEQLEAIQESDIEKNISHSISN
jgi:hypothetical protein